MRSILLEQNDQVKNTEKARRTKNDGVKLLLVLMMVANIGMAQQPDQVADATALWMGSAATRLTGTFPRVSTYTTNTTAAVTVSNPGLGNSAGSLCSIGTGGFSNSCNLVGYTDSLCTQGASFININARDTWTFPFNKTYYAYLGWATPQLFGASAVAFKFALADANITACYESDCIPISCTDANTCAVTPGTYNLNINN
jgi:hypothetical protein